MGPGQLFFEVAGLSLPDAAARFARAGVPVFPCAPDAKNPLTKRGFLDASADPRQVASWWRRWPKANIGLPTGAVSGVEVVDVDRKAGGDGYGAFIAARDAGLVGDPLALVRTPSGGMHVYYPADPDKPHSSWQAPRAHVDFRADGGYVIVPPSVITTDARTGSYYLLVGPSESVSHPVDARALRDFLDPRPTAPTWARQSGPLLTKAEQLASWVALRGEGERNRGLFWASCRLSEAGLSLPEIADALTSAGERAGLPPREIETTIRSAYRTTHTTAAPTSRGQAETSHRPMRLAGRVLA